MSAFLRVGDIEDITRQLFDMAWRRWQTVTRGATMLDGRECRKVVRCTDVEGRIDAMLHFHGGGVRGAFYRTGRATGVARDCGLLTGSGKKLLTDMMGGATWLSCK